MIISEPIASTYRSSGSDPIDREMPMTIKLAFTGTGSIAKVHARASRETASTQLYGTRGMGQLFPTRVLLANSPERGVDEIEPGFPRDRVPHAPQVMYDRQMAYFLECIHLNRVPVPGGLEGLINMKVVDAAYESARTGQVVAIGS
jgi:predicted dehydrogenase